MATQATPRPDPTRLFGITHETTGGAAIVRLPKVLKVGIGLSKGKAIHVYIDAAHKWVVMSGAKDLKERLDTKEAARTSYRKALLTCGERKFPAKLPYFTFTTPNAEGEYEPDFDAIEAHGPLPTAIDIVFTNDSPFEAAMEMWTAAEKKCWGDGVNAMRVLAMANTPEQKKLAEQAKAAGEKYFPIIGGCREGGCSFAGGAKPSCKPHGRLHFQPIRLLRLGGSCQFDTTGYRSISNLSACLDTLKGLTRPDAHERGLIAGVPLKLVVRPYRLRQPDGKPGKAWALHLEYRPETVRKLRTQLLDAAMEFHPAVGEGMREPIQPTLQIPAAEREAIDAKMMAAEFGAAVADENDVQPSIDEDFESQASLLPDEIGDEPSGTTIAPPRRKSGKISAGQIDDLISAWTESHKRADLGKFLQANGVTTGEPGDVLTDNLSSVIAEMRKI